MRASMNAPPSGKPTRPSVILCLTGPTGRGVRARRRARGISRLAVHLCSRRYRTVTRGFPLSAGSGGPLLGEFDHGREPGGVLVVELEICVVQDQPLDP